jgi:hypothetical protein
MTREEGMETAWDNRYVEFEDVCMKSKRWLDFLFIVQNVSSFHILRDNTICDYLINSDKTQIRTLGMSCFWNAYVTVKVKNW